MYYGESHAEEGGSAGLITNRFLRPT
jgi:hypothetical protein